MPTFAFDMDFKDRLLQWYELNGRDLPWRNQPDPYRIWLSEIIMQQTRIAQGLPYYLKFVEELENVEQFANAPLDKILKLWQGLGYYSRARNMHIAAKQVVEDFRGSFPNSFAGLKQLKGVGDYTAAAIASIAFNETVAVVDGNVYRVLSRYFNDSTPIDTGAGKKLFQELANNLIDEKKPGDFNQAMMDFGAMVCTPKTPGCENCIFRLECQGVEANTIDQLPVKSKKVKVRHRFFAFFEIVNDKKVLVQQRWEDDIWKGLYQFPMVEVQEETQLSGELIQKIFPTGVESVESTGVFRHVLTHQRIQANFFKVKLDEKTFNNCAYDRVNTLQFQELALPKLIENYLIHLNKN